MGVRGAGRRDREALVDVSKVGLSLALAAALLVQVCFLPAVVAAQTDSDARFTIAVIPDTQNMVDFRFQRGQKLRGFGEFPFNASDQFLSMLQYIADNSVSNGGDIVFATSVGDIWQRQSFLMDEGHAERGFDYTRFSPIALSGEVGYGPETLEFEIPMAISGYQRLAQAKLPFAVVPGNHDFDAMWTDDRYPGSLFKALFSDSVDTSDPAVIGALHAGGLDNFRFAFGSNSDFFRDKSWYVSSHGGGTSSAQLFSGGGYEFLHIALEMSPPDEAINWARQVLSRYPGYPTIVTTHDYLNQDGERVANPIIDLAALDPDQHNSAQQLFEKLIFPNDQIFLVLCGHQHGQAVRFDSNAKGYEVIQVLADYQDRGQSLLDVDPDIRGIADRLIGIGDGWLRLMQFDFSAEVPEVLVRTYSSHYGGFSVDFESYASWYKAQEKPGVSDAEFMTADQFSLKLSDFRERFGPIATAGGTVAEAGRADASAEPSQ
ncbi:MAG: metallophosphoesterase [Pseudomonadota bacterium]